MTFMDILGEAFDAFGPAVGIAIAIKIGEVLYHLYPRFIF